MATYESRKVGPNEFSFPGYPIQVQVAKYTYEDLENVGGTAFNFVVAPIEAGILVLNVGHLTTDGFVGGTLDTMYIGDSDGIDTYVGGTDMATEGDYFDAKGVPGSGIDGKYYAAADYVVVTRLDSSSAGEGSVFIFYVDTRTNWRTENDL